LLNSKLATGGENSGLHGGRKVGEKAQRGSWQGNLWFSPFIRALTPSP
jgi:hypothetical protein